MGDDSSCHLPSTVVTTTHVSPQRKRSSNLLLTAAVAGTGPFEGSPSSFPVDLQMGTGRRPSSLGRIVSSQSLKNSWRLKYHDFLSVDASAGINAPMHDRTDTFQHVVDKANEWLAKNPEMQVKTCETVTWMSHDATRLGDPELMLLTQNIANDSQTYFVRGLRLWLVPSTSSSSSASSFPRIGFLDVAPSRSDDIQGLVDKVNKKIVHNQVKGELVKVETLGVPLLTKADTPKTKLMKWAENSNDDKDYVFIMRVFQLIGSKTSEKKKNKRKRQQMGVKDFVPMPTEDGYEGYETLTDRCSNWMKGQPEARVINFQSVMIRKTDGPHVDISRSCHYTIPGVSSPDPIEVFRILRVIFAKTVLDGPPVPSWGPESTVCCQVTFETFSPELIRQREADDKTMQLERMKEMYAKVMTFLRTTGADIVGVETVMNPAQDVMTNASFGKASADDRVRFIFKIRLFLTGQSMISDNLPIVRTVKRSSVNPPFIDGGGGGSGGGTQQEDSMAGGGGARSAPLFLGSVVTRRYKYRWMVLSLFGFSCMAIIVVVSVVYSNK